MTSPTTIVRDFPRPSDDILKLYRLQSAATLHEAMGRRGTVGFAVKPLYPGMRVCGPAFPVSCWPPDNLMIHVGVALAQPGDVLVVDYRGDEGLGPWGDVLATAAIARGITGLVIDGTVRDARSMRHMRFPVFARGTGIRGTVKVQTNGTVGLPINIGDTTVNPGDIVVGDDDGVVIVPREEAVETLEKASAREAKEAEMRAQLQAGKTTLDVLNLHPVLEAAGIKI